MVTFAHQSIQYAIIAAYCNHIMMRRCWAEDSSPSSAWPAYHVFCVHILWLYSVCIFCTISYGQEHGSASNVSIMVTNVRHTSQSITCWVQVIVDGMRVRVRLDQQRIASLLAGISPESMGDQFADVASGVLSMLGDMASLSFARYHTGDVLYLPLFYPCCTRIAALLYPYYAPAVSAVTTAWCNLHHHHLPAIHNFQPTGRPV